MERLEAEKRLLQEKLDQPVSAPMSPRNPATGLGQPNQPVNSGNVSAQAAAINQLGMPTQLAASEQAANLTEHIINLRREVSRLKVTILSKKQEPIDI
jgi:hypothetical protein